jgi:hypothetical protein
MKLRGRLGPQRSSGLSVCALIVAAASCGGSSTAPAIAPAPLHGETDDAIGDTFTFVNGVPVPPDLVHATADVTAGNIAFVIQLAPGTLDRQTTRLSILLDTDQTAVTGIRQQNDLGADYGIELAASTGQATITKANGVGCAIPAPVPACFTQIGSASINVGQDVIQVTVPLSLIGNDDGRLSFQVFSSTVVSTSPLSVIGTDAMPNVTAPAARVQ